MEVLGYIIISLLFYLLAIILRIVILLRIRALKVKLDYYQAKINLDILFVCFFFIVAFITLATHGHGERNFIDIFADNSGKVIYCFCNSVSAKKDNLEKDYFKQEIIDFSRKKVPELYNVLIETSSMINDIENKKNKLTNVLKEIGRNADKDEEIIRFNKLLGNLENSQKDYNKFIKESYLLYHKYIILSDPSYKKIIEKFNLEANSTFKINVDNYKELRKITNKN